MLKTVIVFAFFTFALHINCNGQGVIEAIKNSHIFEKPKGADCKNKSTYKKKRLSLFKKSPVKKSTPYQYVYTSKSAAPPKSPPSPPVRTSTTTTSVTARKEPPKEKVVVSTKTPSGVPVEKNDDEIKTETVKPNPLKAMTPGQRKTAVLDMPPTRSLTPIRFISNQDEFSVVNMDSFMEALELVNQGKIVLIEGHTDDIGSDDYNLKLSMKRVEKIRQLMLQAGGDDNFISVMGYGEKRPLVPNSSTENRQINRRIEFKVFEL